MSEPIRYESAERVRDFYRNQGRDAEQMRIIQIIESVSADAEVTASSSERIKLNNLIKLIKRGIK